MSSINYFKPLPAGLSPAQHQEWQRRQRIAESTLDAQTTLPDAATVESFQRYVRGELTLGEAIERVRQQVTQEREMLRLYINRRNII